MLTKIRFKKLAYRFVRDMGAKFFILRLKIMKIQRNFPFKATVTEVSFLPLLGSQSEGNAYFAHCRWRHKHYLLINKLDQRRVQMEFSLSFLEFRKLLHCLPKQM